MDSEFFLYPVFEELRQQGVPLGVSEYLTALDVMRKGKYLETRESLQRLCRLLWAKSREDQELFDRVFEQEIPKTPTIFPSPIPYPPDNEPFHTPTQRMHTGQTEHSVQEKAQTTHRSKPQRLPLPDVSLQDEPLVEPSYQYQLNTRLPIDRRDMIGILRHLRKLQREGPPEELDVQSTIDLICRSGLFIRPVLQPRRRNRARLVLFIDQSDSMAPFALLIEAFIESVLRSGLHRQTRIFYFNNYPGSYVFETPKRTRSRPLEEVFANDCQGQGVLIISDAGAARGEYKISRVEATKTFINALRQHTYLYTWLNPMPTERWRRTTAEDIRMFVPMYHLDRDGLNDTVNILQGHPFPQEIRFHD